MISDPWPVVLCFPDQNSRSPDQDQHGHKVPSTSAIAPFVASEASSADGLSPAVTSSISGVNFAMIREMFDCDVSNISARTSSMMCCRVYAQVMMIASLRVRLFGQPIPLSQGSFQQFFDIHHKLVELLWAET
jgi:hypothetical protein